MNNFEIGQMTNKTKTMETQTKMGILESNKLIAEFMGWEKAEQLEKGYCAWNIAVNQMKPDEMKFHLSWDWLMPVVEKILTISIEPFSIGGYIQENIKDNLIQGIGIAHKTVIEFIKWYNKNEQ